MFAKVLEPTAAHLSSPVVFSPVERIDETPAGAEAMASDSRQLLRSKSTPTHSQAALRRGLTPVEIAQGWRIQDAYGHKLLCKVRRLSDGVWSMLICLFRFRCG